MNISLVMICKDEAGGLQKAVESARPLVNEIIIGVDDKSIDKTWEIAQELADFSYQFTWKNDFSKARNDALDKSHGDWNLILDGHEYITKHPVMEFIDVPDGVDAMLVEVMMEDGEICSSERILRNDVRYKNAVHNEPVTHKSMKLTDFSLMHDRHQQSKTVIRKRNKQRRQMLLRLLKDDTFRSHWYLAQEYRGFDAHKAITHYKKALSLATPQNEEIAKSIGYYLSQMYYECGQVRKALMQCDGELMEYGFVRGMIYFREKNYSQAVSAFLSALTYPKIEDSSRPVKDLEFEIYDFLSQCLYELKAVELARTAALKALEYREDERVRNNVDAFVTNLLAPSERDAEYYNLIFKDGYDTTRYADMYKVVMRLLGKMDNPRILEAGCGVGSLGRIIIDAGYTYAGFDFSAEAIKKALELVPSGNFYVGNVYDAKEYDGDYDVVVATEVLEHVDDLKMLSAIPSGKTFIGSVPTFGDAAHLRVYRDQQKDIVNRFHDEMAVTDVFYSDALGIFIFKGVIQ